jgi:histidinol-phosphate/aromatic aminotransferase/cobyric acid decarboxylase-like protein
MVVLANPTPPGIALTLEAIKAIAPQTWTRVLLIDESLCGLRRESAVPLTKKYENMPSSDLFQGQLQAGAPLGYAIGNAELIGDLYSSSTPEPLQRKQAHAGRRHPGAGGRRLLPG